MRRTAGGTAARTGLTGSASVRKRRRLVGAVAVYFALILLVTMAAVIFSGSGEGTVVIEAADQKVAAALSKNGIRLLDVTTGREFTLRPGRNKVDFGDYEVDLAELPSWIEISTTHFGLRRGEGETLTVVLTRKDD